MTKSGIREYLFTTPEKYTFSYQGQQYFLL